MSDWLWYQRTGLTSYNQLTYPSISQPRNTSSADISSGILNKQHVNFFLKKMHYNYAATPSWDLDGSVVSEHSVIKSTI